MTFETVDYSAADSVARIVLNRPDRLNAINRQLMRTCARLWQRQAKTPPFG